jgi:hypothetical protein
MKALAVLVVVFVLSAGCATWKPEGAATLHVACNVPEAAVLLDDAMVGRVSELVKENKFIRPGFYRVEIRCPGYYSYFTEFTVADGGVAAVKTELHPLLD